MLIGLLIGAAVGAAVALIYTPHNGKQNRHNLSQMAKDRLSAARSKIGV